MKLLSHDISQTALMAARAFTLLELLVALAIFTIVLAAINTVFYTAIRLRNTTTASLEQTLPLEQALNLMQRDLANLTMTTGIFCGPLQSANPSNALPNQISPTFCTSDGQLDGLAPWGNVQQVCYVLADPTNRLEVGKDLMRAVTRNLLPVTTVEPEQHLLLSGVQNVTFSYYDGTQWASSWDSTVQTNLPAAIKVQIQMASATSRGAQGADTPVELVVPVDVQVTTNQTLPVSQ